MSGRPLIALSIADAQAQTELGYGKEHLTEALVRIGRHLLRRGCDLAYGGDLRAGGFTQLLLHLVRAENDSVTTLSRLRRSDKLRRLINYLSWPRYGDLTPDLQARYLGVCRFVRVPPPRESGDAPPGEPQTAQQRLREALALSAMRRAMTLGGAADVDGKKVPAASARLVLGGKVEGYNGLMPGILEEVAWALSPKPPLPVFVLGGFGGAAAVLAKGFFERVPPPELTYAWHDSRHPALAGMVAELAAKSPNRELHPERHYELLKRACAKGVAWLARGNGLSKTDNETLLFTGDLTEVLRVLAKAKALGGEV